MLSLIHAYNTIGLSNRQGEDSRVQSADRRNGEGELGREITCTDASLSRRKARLVGSEISRDINAEFNHHRWFRKHLNAYNLVDRLTGAMLVVASDIATLFRLQV